MSTIVQMRRKGSTLIPTSEHDEEALRGGLGEDEVVMATLRKARHPANHRRFWVLMDMLYENTDKFGSVDELRGYLMIASGHCRTLIDHNGRVNYWPDSIAWEKMDELEFRRVFKDVIDAALKYVVPGWNRDILTDVAEFG